MHIYFSGIGGTGLGPLALIASQAGYTVSGSDKQDSQYIQYLAKHGVTDVEIDQSYEAIARRHAEHPIDWLVYTSALTAERKDPDELRFCRNHSIRVSLRDELLNAILEEKDLQLIAIAGTHGKTTTTAMTIWLFNQLDLPISYSVGAKIPFGDMGHYEPDSRYFAYEADEYARNFLSFYPEQGIIVGIDYDHPDIYPTRVEYEQAFAQFAGQCKHVVMWQDDTKRLPTAIDEHFTILEDAPDMLNKLSLIGAVNRRNACQVITAVQRLTGIDEDTLIEHMNRFPGLSRRFEQLRPGLYTDYAHTPPKVRGALQIAEEVAPGRVVVVYEGLHNTRQHFIKSELAHLFDEIKQCYIVPSYLAREDPNLPLLSPTDLRNLLSETARAKTEARQLDDQLRETISSHLSAGDLVLCLTAGGGNSLDEWLRHTFPAV